MQWLSSGPSSAQCEKVDKQLIGSRSGKSNIYQKVVKGQTFYWLQLRRNCLAVYSPITTELEEAIEWLAEVTHKFEEVDATMKESGTSFDQAVEVLNRGVLLKFKIVRGIQKQTVDTPFMMDLASALAIRSKLEAISKIAAARKLVEDCRTEFPLG